MSLSRLYKWVYTHLDEVPEKGPYIEPERNWTIWNGTECEKWLNAHGLIKTGSENCAIPKELILR